MTKFNTDELLAQATCAIRVDGQIKGTAWLVSDEGYLLTAGHILGTTKQNVLNEVEICFPEDTSSKAGRVLWDYQWDKGIDFAVLKLDTPIKNRQPLPLCLVREVEGSFRARGYGENLVYQSSGEGKFLSTYDLEDNSGYRLFLLRSKELGIGGYSGSAIFSDELQAVVAIQTRTTDNNFGGGRDTVLAMPLYRIAHNWYKLNQLEKVSKISLNNLAQLPSDTISPITSLPKSTKLPFRYNKLFVNRHKELKQIAFYIKSTSQDIVPVVIISGLGGVGKSQLAVEFAYRYGQYFDGIFWLNFSDAESVSAEIAGCGGPTGLNLLPQFHTLELTEQIQLVQAAWQEPTPRLLIFDNCESERLLNEWLPRTGGCRVLVTSRRKEWSPNFKIIPLSVLPQTDSITLLHHHQNRLSRQEADKIAEMLGNFPLALHVAGSFLSRYERVDGDSYLKQLQEQPVLAHRSFQQAKGVSPTEHDLSLIRTFELSYNQLDSSEQVNQYARTLIHCAACFVPNQPIPEKLLLESLKLFFPSLNDNDLPFIFDDASNRLLTLGLIEMGADVTSNNDKLQSNIILHPLVTEFIQFIKVDDTPRQVVEKVVLELSSQINKTGSPISLLAWQAHFRLVTNMALQRRGEQAASLANELGKHLTMVAQYDTARSYYEQALNIRKDVLGEQHEDTIITLNDIGTLFDLIGDYETASSYYQQALTISSSAFGEQHLVTARSLNNMGLLSYALGDYETAQPYFEQALHIRRKIRGEKHPDIAQSLNNIGLLFYTLGEYKTAQPYFEQALAIRKEMLGEHHYHTAQSLNNLGALLFLMEQYKTAQSYYEQALAIRKEVLGEHHPDTANSLNNLGFLLFSMRKHQIAQLHYEQALAIRKEVLGEHHPDTAQSLNNLGALFYALKNYETALPYYKQALSIRLNVFGENHPKTAHSLNNLGVLFEDMDDYETALSYYEQALTIRRDLLGEHHPDTIQILSNLDRLLNLKGRL